MNFEQHYNESIDPYAAVLVAHTKPFDMKKIEDVVKILKSYGQDINSDNINDAITKVGLSLKSAHPSAVENLNKNLQKIDLGTEDVQDILGVPSHGSPAHFGNAQEYAKKPYMRSRRNKLKIDVDLSDIDKE